MRNFWDVIVFNFLDRSPYDAYWVPLFGTYVALYIFSCCRSYYRLIAMIVCLILCSFGISDTKVSTWCLDQHVFFCTYVILSFDFDMVYHVPLLGLVFIFVRRPYTRDFQILRSVSILYSFWLLSDSVFSYISIDFYLVLC